ncbi:MAG: carbohydrate ABC transporter permease, partial [Chloroflexi bacterium]|nr:carbohydrate ABC transporter permease [Chloroflexota bacterium]
TFLPRVPSIYTVQLDYSDVALPEDVTLEQAIREDMAIVTWRIPDYLSDIHLGAIRAEAYLDGKKVADTFLPTQQYAHYRGQLWVTQRLSDRLVRRELDRALFPTRFNMNLNGLAATRQVGEPNEETARIAELFEAEIQPTGKLLHIGERRYLPAVFNNFITAWRAPGKLYKGMTFAGYMANSFRITIAEILLQWIVSGLAAYALSRVLTPKFSRLWTIFFLITMMVPGVATLIPSYEMVGKMGLHDRLLGVILPSIPGAFTIYLFKGFFDALPGEIFDASRIDGASEFEVFFRIVIPMSKNVFTVIGLLTFLGSWSSFFWPYLILRSPKVWTFTVAIYMASAGGASAAGGNAMASSVMAAIPTLLVFAIFSRSIQQGMVWSGLKG